MKILIIISLIISMNLYSQPVDLKFTKTDKTIIMTLGAAGLATNYIFYKIETKQDTYLKATISGGCVFFASLPILAERFTINENGMTFKIILVGIKKNRKCPFNPYKINNHARN